MMHFGIFLYFVFHDKYNNCIVANLQSCHEMIPYGNTQNAFAFMSL